MVRILAIADDLTGAAEIAAAGLRHGLPSRLARSPVTRLHTGLTVLDTDTRNLPPAEAAAVVAKFIPTGKSDKSDGVKSDAGKPDTGKTDAGKPERMFDFIFKKTDSVLRGPILAELHAIMSALGMKSTVLVPQNPSKARTISDGAYHIAGVPLAKTSFGKDPTYPAWTSNALQLLVGSGSLKATHREPGEAAPIPLGVVLGGGETEADLDHWASRSDPTVLPAGGVDFFRASLRKWGFPEVEERPPVIPPGKRLFICGSPPGTENLLHKIPGRILFLPTTMANAKTVVEGVRDQLARGGICAVSVPQERSGSADAPHRFEERMAHVSCTILSQEKIDTVFLEGGSTASAVFRWMGFLTFRVEGQLAPGVVVMTVGNESDGQRVVVKPGSYLWPDDVFRQ